MLDERDQELLKRYLKFYQDLDSGRREPQTDLQDHFVEVCRGDRPPVTKHEIAYIKYKNGGNLPVWMSSLERDRMGHTPEQMPTEQRIDLLQDYYARKNESTMDEDLS